MILAVRNAFDTIHSIELGDGLYASALSKTARYSHIRLWHGDSAKVLPDVLRVIGGRCLFWLDAHYSHGITARAEIETPIAAELRHLLTCHWIEPIILVDDARLFIGTRDYPTLEEVARVVLDYKPSWHLCVEDDIIRIHGAS